MMQLLQTMMADREAERAERQANLAALQQLARNNQGHGNHDHPGSKLKNFQNTNPPMFSKTEEPLDADDWLQTMENNLEVAGVEAAEKVLFATHYLSGPARAWWTSARAMIAGQMMTWEDFKLKFSKYHVPQGLIKKMRDEFRELNQGRMSVVEYRDRFLTLSRNPSNDILGIGRNQRPGSYFPRSFQNTGKDRRGATGPPGGWPRGLGLARAALPPRRLFDPLRRLFAYIKPPKTLTREGHDTRKVPEPPPSRSQDGDRSLCSGTLPDGEVPRKASPSTPLPSPPPSSSTLLLHEEE
ncbi:hypothetical protein QYE76_001340 [Lolium multiflorum]|uniref:Retrotransposon gag domain-containing protein n=1 Tax=Lolium multiflorum TaxID=4521 RepID=A0AAD8RLN2_LOLMU|nr:hypothetical protein QYE76_001340 [Lolium multiflorum]